MDRHGAERRMLRGRVDGNVSVQTRGRNVQQLYLRPEQNGDGGHYKAWNGSIDPKVSQPGEADGVKYFYSVASDYVDWMTKQYLLNKA
ncbi:MAG: hypothetical protein ACLRSW_09630 [Christensenellaceae bacterium]